ncbi:MULTISPECIES: diaminopimelate decarboxylase [unclassified Pseudodesulfovibrio]|uniref:diaminopimelate decarboxylase n=1 Tax=unclassified Pseudodesulfovibrio TaxID=2661612 RepID=UPI000FEBE1FF|nr:MULTISPECIES: diaminopimelate decarboxylase [unclassified Pseudodesulfovibrio]MCJ2163853.1 diaminopimelate decarboxylase [Pseudodesulfovibrio sp. S3-i]RWU05901.1 diaminopimelate decarboxylase [Pseudodesulfovibrio sp. S3]
MHHFEHRDGVLFAEELSVTQLAETYGTPLYIYSAATFKRHYQAFDSAFKDLDHLTCFSVKANSNLSVLKLLAEQGAGMDIVSGGELYRALRAGVDPSRIVYSGVGKRDSEIREALEASILMFNVESVAELERINAVAGEMGTIAQVGFRINPNVDPQTHPYISTGMQKNKFGLDVEHSMEAYKMAAEMPNVEPIGMDCHIGSQLTSISPFLEALDILLSFYEELIKIGINIKYLDLGGGLGIPYDAEEPPHPTEFGQALSEKLKGLPLKVILEPGRVIAGNAGIMVTKVVYTKSNPSKNFLIVDAGMNDLIRPSLYGSFHRIEEVEPKGRAPKTFDVVGPICESGDFLARDRELPEVKQTERLVLYSAGAYGFTMSSNYNSRPRACELLVDGDKVTVARKRETYDDLIINEL